MLLSVVKMRADAVQTQPNDGAADALWLHRFTHARRLRESAVFHRYSAHDVDTGARRLVVVGAPKADPSEMRTRLDEAARVLRLLCHEHIPKVDQRARVGEIEYLSLCCAADDDLARLWQYFAAAGLKIDMGASAGLSDRFLSAIVAAHSTIDPNTSQPVCLGSFAWENLLLSESGEPYFLGFGDDLLAPHPDFTGALVCAPEVMLGARPTPGSDLWGVLTLFRSVLALRELPAPLERVLKGHPLAEDRALQEALRTIHEQVLVSPEARNHDSRWFHAAYQEVWELAGVQPSLEAFRVLIFAARSQRDASAGERQDPLDLGRSRYRVQKPLGQGATSVVYLARDRQLGVDVAVKSLRDDAHPRTYARLLREARLLRRIAHPHVVRGFNVEVYDGQLCLVMEFVDGPELSAWSRHVAVPARLAALAEIADALAATHGVGIVHGDVKPANVIVTRERGAVLVDFGGARDVREEELVASLATGTPRYLAPERRAGERASAASDVYSFGIMAAEVLLEESQDASFGPAALARLPVSPALATTLGQALDPAPHQRPGAAELASALAPRRVVVRTGLTVGPEGAWFRVGEGEIVDLSRRQAARRIFWALASRCAQQNAEPLATFDLLTAGWPDERILPEAGAHRVYVALNYLRKLGLGDLLVRVDTGYRLAGVVEMQE